MSEAKGTPCYEQLDFCERKMLSLEEKNHELEEALQNCVKLIDSILPQMGKIAVDIGLLNDTLIQSRTLLDTEK